MNDIISTVFLDRDGVINRLRPDYVRAWSTFEFLPRAPEAIRLLNEAGLRIVVVTNQRAVARGLLSVAELQRIHDRMRAELAHVGASIDAIYYCPHDKGACSCRKPNVGMFLQAQQDDPLIDFQRSVVVGDSVSDMQAGSQLGCRLILVTDTGQGHHDAANYTDVRNDTDQETDQQTDPETDPETDLETAQELTAKYPLDGVASTLYDAVVEYILPMYRRDGVR